MTKKLNFSEILEWEFYPISSRSELYEKFSILSDYVYKSYDGTLNYKKRVIDVINTIVYRVLNSETVDSSWNSNYPLDTIDLVDDSECRDNLCNLYLTVDNVIWDVESDLMKSGVNFSKIFKSSIDPKDVETIKSRCIDDYNYEPMSYVKEVKFDTKFFSKNNESFYTSKEDLYLRGPDIPRFDPDKVWLSGIVDGELWKIWAVLPEIPRIQREINITTDVNKMSRRDLLNLYPKNTIRTRYSCMYSTMYNELPYDEMLGILTPVEGFTEEQIRENIIKYPHLYKLKRKFDKEFRSFYNEIEINGELYKTKDVWNELPESKIIPKVDPDFVKDYVARRYLLERDVLGIQHKYPMFTQLDPFITLFTTKEQYEEFDVGDIVEIAKQCVISRVSYHQSQNPMMRKILGDNWFNENRQHQKEVSTI